MSPVSPTPLAERFWPKVDRSGGPDACWPFVGARTRGDYGAIGVGKTKVVRANRVAWELTNGPIPDGLGVLHTCDNPPCCNPAHLFLGTAGDNARDAAAKGRLPGGSRRTVCPVGHPYDAANTIVRRLGWRQCRECKRASNRARRARTAA